ncbi:MULTISPECIES: CS1 type fimbrial major subunit [unclassified Pseudomonas]|uniref:CS1 type fimbrial major subunit n=1 Tax=unclassified Pseudomonas TaxID=196821 RepID=UPI000BA37996|nr:MULTISPECIES: CS1 type fimbrial major subunit [unclassified Pseudomonas]MCU1733030.1 fimbrial protein [Pseudomonas sp. 20P_3.2_Bac4]MCU1744131.1 fimbrial protein [Pseudomonas sp. 20P_3.2_Bac5]
MKYRFFALPLALMLASGGASAVQPIEGNFTVSGTVPTESFSVIDPANWMSQTQTLNWNVIGTGFTPLQQKLLLKSTVGAITAYMLEPAQISSGDNVIPMQVAVNMVALTESPRIVLRADLAPPGLLVQFNASVLNPSTIERTPGDYAGTLSMMFETAPPL